jgi:gluconate 2-dehydrogenase gamma chain
MMGLMSFTRREWTLSALAAAWQHAHQAATSPTPVEFQFFSPSQALQVEALAAQIIPSDGTPGAKEAGAIYFIDRALATFDKDKRALYAAGLADLQERCRSAFPEAASVAALAPQQLVSLMKSIETTPFFETLRAHTILGFCGPPSYGGNRGGVGWAHIGVEDKMIFQPPFGYYDAEEIKGRP